LTSRAAPRYRLSVPIAAPRQDLRADAARNRERIVSEARAIFAESGIDVSTDEIARRAGVGKGTLYRRFPTKQSLVHAVLRFLIETIERASAEALTKDDPFDGLAGFLAASTRLQEENLAFFQAIVRGVPPATLPQDVRERYIAAAAGPLERARRAGSVRPDLEPEDLAVVGRMLGAAANPLPQDRPPEGAWRRYLALVLDGFRPGAPDRLPGEPYRPGPDAFRH
jgi:AcrR family transcriptional regulator